jgi:predicted transcriptional regulator
MYQLPEINRMELKVLILRKYGNQKEFAKQHRINHSTLRCWLAGRKMRHLERKLIKIMNSHGLNADGSQRINNKPMLQPGIRMDVINADFAQN